MLGDLYDTLREDSMNMSKKEALMFIKGITSMSKSEVEDFLENMALDNGMCPKCYEDTETSYSWYTDDEGYVIEEPSLFCDHCGWSIDD